MISYQERFNLPTQVVSQEQFWALVKAPKTAKRVAEAREALEKGDKVQYDKKKKQLPLMIFVGTFDESDKVVEQGLKKEKMKVRGCWRNQKNACLNGLVVADYDHLEGDVRVIWDEVFAKLSDEDKARIVLVYVTPSGQGLKVVFKADAGIGNLIDNQLDLSEKLGLKLDESCKDASRGAFMTTDKDIILLNEVLFTYENKGFAEKYGKAYRAGKSGETKKVKSGKRKVKSEENSQLLTVNSQLLQWHGYDIQSIIDKRFEKKLPCKEDSNRHKESLKLASDLLVMLDGDRQAVLQIVEAQSWVQEIIEERNENVEQTVDSAAERMAEREKKYLTQSPSKAMQEAIEAVTGKTFKEVMEGIAVSDERLAKRSDVYSSLPLEEWAEELKELSRSFPCMKELFMNVHPMKLPAVLFSSAAMLGTLMTRTWYHFWYDPDLVRRLNYSIFVIGDPGAGKNLIEKIYNILMKPVKEKDNELISQVNDYKDSRTERSTSTKAQKGDALKRPSVPIRLHPARTATGEFIRHMQAAKETIQGRTLYLHMFSFDSELDNVTGNNKGGDWKNRSDMELKAFHNEEDGQMYANMESVTGTFNIFWNFVYTGTSYALGRKVTQRNFGNGLASRLAVIPMPDAGIASRNQKRDAKAKEVLAEWAERLDKVEGELPIEPLNDETYEWQSSHLEIAEFNGDKADRTLLKRVPYYGISIAIPFIVMRHWNEWQEKHMLTMDEKDRRLCRLAMEIQYRCQHFFFGEMAHNYFEDQGKVFVSRKRTSRYQECYSKLPERFTTKQFQEVFGCTQPAASKNIQRFIRDGVMKQVKYGLYKKVLQALQ